MRVLMVSKACIVGQYQTKLEALARKAGLELTVVVPPFWKDDRGITPLERTHVTGYSLLVQPIALQGHFHLHHYPTLSQVLRRERPDLVHIDEEPYNFATFHALRAARSVNARTLFFSWQNLARRYPPPFSWFETYVYHHVDYAIAGTTEAAGVLRSKGYTGPLRVIPQFGVDPDRFAPPTCRAERSRFRIGFAGRLVEEKGAQTLLRSLAGMEGDWELRLLGGGPLREGLAAQARELGIQDRVHLEAWHPSTEMPAYFGQIDLFVLPSQSRPNWKEQFGRVLVEAMACQVPVIGSDCGEIPNVIGDAGLVFPENDFGALRTHIDALRRDPDRRIELGRRGRARVLARYTQERVAEETYQVYTEILSA